MNSSNWFQREDLKCRYNNDLMNTFICLFISCRKVVHELYSQLQAHSEPKQYLIKICDVLLKQDDQRLKDIANNIKDKLEMFCLFYSLL